MKFDEKDGFFDEIFASNKKGSFERLKNIKVAIAGCGGIGSNLAIALARSGILNLHIIDFDVVELKNLNRQYYFLNDINAMKTEALKSHINAINPFVNVICQNVKITLSNASEIFRNDDIICEALDDEVQKSEFVSEISTKFSDKFVIATSGISGININNLGVKKFGEKLFVCGDFTDNDVLVEGFMAPKVTMCAMMAANTLINIVLNEKFG